MIRKLLFALIIVCLPVLAFGQVKTTDAGKPTKNVTDASIVAFNYWHQDTVYILTEKVFVEDGEVLIIEAGTVVKGNPGAAANSTCLVVARGGRIYAEGTKTEPIIFTGSIDDLTLNNDIPLDTINGLGLWGGLIILGNAGVGNGEVANSIEGLLEGDPRTLYGGADDDDNSGVLKYVSLRHCGTEVGAANEINGLTMGAVGRGTTISHVEVFWTYDDGYEWFGGTVNADHIVAAFAGDDGFDYDQGFRGCIQYGFIIQQPTKADKGGEHDGGTELAVDAQPFATPLFTNITIVGAGSTTGPSSNRVFDIRDNAGAGYFNSIFTGFRSYGPSFEDKDAEPTDTRDRLLDGQVAFDQNIWWDFGVGNTATLITNSVTAVEDALFSGDADAMTNLIFDPALAGITRTPTGTLDPRPTADLGANGWGPWVQPVGFTFGADDRFTGEVWPKAVDSLLYGTGSQAVASYPTAIDVDWDPVVAVDFPGAFDPDGDLWICTWTGLDAYDYLVDDCDMADCFCITDDNKPTVNVTDAGLEGLTVWQRENVYILTEKVFVEDGDTLIIEPGTIVKGNPGAAANSTALVVARGGLIYAMGAQDCPIVMTGSIDDVDLFNDVPLDTINGVGLWGGLTLLGNAGVGNGEVANSIEGLLEGDPRTLYGGADDYDTSGILQYVSLRHCGTEVGAANEINGLTMGGVGKGTQISHIEVFWTYDDGYEWFGGTVDCDHLIAAFAGDDGFDYDQGFRGRVQYGFIIQQPTKADKGGEYDGGTELDVAAVPYATPLFVNVTIVGAGSGSSSPSSNRGFDIRDNAGVGYFNSIFTQFRRYGLSIENNDGEPTDSRDRLLAGQIKFCKNIWWDFGNGNNINAMVNNDTLFAGTLFQDNMNYIFDPELRSISRTPDGGLDPRPTFFGCWSGWCDPEDPANGFAPPPGPNVDVDFGPVEVVDFPGAFDPDVAMTESWAASWTSLDCYGYLGDAPVPTKGVVNVTDASVGNLAGSEKTVWTNDNTYFLTEKVFVEDTDTLVIEAGTVVKGNPGAAANSTALVVARGGVIIAEGTQHAPIIMTGSVDDVTNYQDVPLDTINGVGLWGGLIILGNAGVGNGEVANSIEGLLEGDPRSLYGGAQDDASSGIVKYVSLRHCGTEVGAANEINGLTMGGVGNGTVISNVEVFWTYDDGYEWFGGTVDCDHLIAAFAGDDGFDYDQGFRGRVQFGFIIQQPTKADKGGEHDGGTELAVDAQPFATPLFSNITFIGAGSEAGPSSNRVFDIRDNAGTAYLNSIFSQFRSYGPSVESKVPAEPTDSRARLAEGNVLFKGNIWWDFGAGATPAAITNNVAVVQAAIFDNGNDDIFDPEFRSISRVPDNGLFPVPDPSALVAWGPWVDPSTTGYPFTPAPPYAGAIDVDYGPVVTVDYPGAFNPDFFADGDSTDLWTNCWTALENYGYIGSVINGGGGCCVGITGDVNDDTFDADVADVVYMVEFSFGSPAGPAPICAEEGDLNGDTFSADVADIVYAVEFSFSSPAGPAPVPCP